jgi:KDO2-lipid IV(A) lauroyltransferase
MHREDEEAAKYTAVVRLAAGINVAYAREDPMVFLNLMGTLRRNGIVAIQGDRPYGGRSVSVSFFGSSMNLPAGPWALARASGAPLLTGALVFDREHRCRSVWSELIRVPEGAAGSIRSEGGPQRPADAMARPIKSHPDQWFNFYDVWQEEGEKERPSREAGVWARLRASLGGRRRKAA